MSSGYPNQLHYPGVAFPALQPPAPLPDKPGRPWPLGKVNRWMTIGTVVATLLAIALAVLASQIVSKPPATTGMTLAYQSDLTRNDSGQLHWDDTSDCQFTSSGYLVTDTGSNSPIPCTLQGSSYADLTLKVRIVGVSGIALIGFFGDDMLEIFGSGRFYFYHPSDDPAVSQAARASTGFGSAALHPSTLGVSDGVNDIVIHVQGTIYSFYANGQLLETETVPLTEAPGSISLGAVNGQAMFSDMVIYRN
jgi:hypothetical protein